MKGYLEKFSDFLASKESRYVFLAFILIFLGVFLTTEYQRGQSAVCNGARFVIERNVTIERKLIKDGDIEGARKLHNSLVKLAEMADDCDFDLFKYLKRKHI